MRPSIAVSLCLALAALALPACGGGKSDEDQISDAIVQTVTTTSKENCTDLQTQRFDEQVTFESGADAVKSCSDPDSNEPADSAQVSNVQVDGDAATADVAIKGSTFDGQTVKVSLVKQGDQWKLDHIDDFVNFDQQKFADSFAKSATEGKNPLTQAQASCVASGFANASAGAVKTVVLSGKAAALVPVLRRCGVIG